MTFANVGSVIAALLLVAASLGLSNLAAAIGIGAGGIDASTRWRVGIIFGCFEAAMPIAGLLLGRDLASSLGRSADWLAAGLLVLVGGAGIVSGVRNRSSAAAAPRPAAAAQPRTVRPGIPQPRTVQPGIPQPRTVQLVLTGFALSLDNAAAGFALGSYRVGVLAGAIVFGVVSAAMSLAGLEFGARIGARAGEAGRIIGGAVVVAVGIAIGLGALG